MFDKTTVPAVGDANTAEGRAVHERGVEQLDQCQFATEQEVKSAFDRVREAITERHRAAVARALEKWRTASDATKA
jgi:hypothetical protein